MRSAIRKHLSDFIAIVVLFIMALGIGGYILSNQRLRFPLIESKPLTIKADLPDAQAVTPGQGQTVRIAGVEVGQIGKVNLENGHAVVDLEINPKYKHLIHQDATALLRSKTGLKDMFVEVDPGDGKPPLKSGEHIRLSNTLPDVDPDEFLSALDADTRDYLKLLITGAGKGLQGRGKDLQNTFAEFGPLHRDLARATQAFAERRRNLRRLVHNYGLLVQELGGHQHDLTTFVQASNAVFRAFASENQNIALAVHRLPGALNQTVGTLHKVDRLAGVLPPALNSLRPAFRQLDVANHQVIPFAREATPIIRKQIRPFTRIARPYFRDLGNASSKLARANPQLRDFQHGLNRLFNMGAYNPNGREGVSSSCASGTGACTAHDRDRNEGYLYWLAWAGQNTVSLFSTADANGPYRRAYINGLQCADIKTAIHQSLDPVVSGAPAPIGGSGGVVDTIETNFLNAIDQLGVSGACQT
jgi:phospholipid/cholesterol/gamma-HCH transport system substrate-binding protein